MVALLLLGIMRLLIIYASGEILLRWDAKASARPPLSSSHYGLQRQCCAWEADKRSAAASAPASRHRTLLEFSGSSTSAEPPQKSLTIRERGMRDRVGKRRLRLASSMPLTPMGKSTDRHLPSWHRQCCAPRVNIIYRDCVTSFGAPSPNLFSRCTQSRLCSNLLCINKFSRCASNPPCRVGRQHWVRSACRSTLHNASPRTTCPASWAAACGQSGSRNLRR